MTSQARDRSLIMASAFLRATATGMIGVLLGLYLASLHFTPGVVGRVVSAGLSGAALASLFATLRGDLHGRRRTLIEIAVLGTIGGGLAASAVGAWPITAAAFLGMLNGMGRDRGASLILEQAILPGTVTAENRTRMFAWYNVLQDAGHALGSLLAALPSMFHRLLPAASDTTLFRGSMWVYVVLAALPIAVYLKLSPAVENRNREAPAPISPRTRKILWRIGALFGLDGLGGGFLTSALLTYFFFERFHASPGAIGVLFFGARVANAFSHLGAAWLAHRIGLVNTMVFTHMPSSLLLVTVAFAPSFPVAAVLFLLREGLVEMDVPTRQSYVLAVAQPEERTRVSGVTHLVRIAAWAVAPLAAGGLMQGVSLLAPLVIGAAMKLLYDVLLFFAFRKIRPPEEN